jgi:hypothetical protein
MQQFTSRVSFQVGMTTELHHCQVECTTQLCYAAFHCKNVIVYVFHINDYMNILPMEANL